MAFKCVHCKKRILDDNLKIPRSGALCPHCKQDPTEGWSPYKPSVAEAGRKAADEMNLRLISKGDWAARESALFFLEDMILENRHEISVRMGRAPGFEHKCSVCGNMIPGTEGFHIEIADRWRSTAVTLSLCERHLSEGLWGREYDIHANHRDSWVTRGDWHYAGRSKESSPATKSSE